ncbi:hypothetical protein LTR84_010745 [Exophiala bonariae]|uniref:FAD/NAD(P)-binding domain-containing protein n=1 Tax=Exophiala bonariae TaxID=1690606 RepID=A0AAV9MST7_9EURO|nr:hypothetical protein LTR84_010745 [Exophiala bonariae]
MASNVTAPQWDRGHIKDPAVLIIGAGISGLCAAIDLIRFNGTRNCLLSRKQTKSEELGTITSIRDAAVMPNANWSREYPGQEEIHQYLIGVAQKWGLYRHIRFNTEVDEAHWQEKDKQWQTAVRVTGGKAAEFGDRYNVKSDFLISCNNPMDEKRVAIIGNGATAAQIVPEIAKVAKDLTVFQRTPNWIVPRADQAITKSRQAIYKYIPAWRRRYRAQLMDLRESFYDAAVVEDSNMNNEIIAASTAMLKSQLTRKPELINVLTPDYPPGCKRIIISDDYYPALNRPNVHLETLAIHKITPSGIMRGGKELKLDAIILATGFRTGQFLTPTKLFGVGGRPLQQVWSQGVQAYLGITAASLPNFAMLYGPNTNLGHNSIILMIEAQSRYVARMILEVTKARERGETLKIVPRQTKLDAYNREIQERLAKSTFASPKCNSWYKTEAGVVINNWSGNVLEYQSLLSSVDWSDFELSGSAAANVSEARSSYIGRVVEESPGWLALAQTSAVTILLVAATAMVLSRFLIPSVCVFL